VNPPFFCPLVEVVPSPWTDPEISKLTMTIMKEIGQTPVLLKKEIPGFALNRIQYALMMECWRLIQVNVIYVSWNVVLGEECIDPENGSRVGILPQRVRFGPKDIWGSYK
jgi:hypothetical protein